MLPPDPRQVPSIIDSAKKGKQKKGTKERQKNGKNKHFGKKTIPFEHFQ